MEPEVSIVTFGEMFTRNASGNRHSDGRVHTVAERLDTLNSKLVGYMVILGQAKRQTFFRSHGPRGGNP